MGNLKLIYLYLTKERRQIALPSPFSLIKLNANLLKISLPQRWHIYCSINVWTEIGYRPAQSGAEKDETHMSLTAGEEYKVLVAVDFSPCSAHALKSARSIMGRKPDHMFVLHVIDDDFIEKCISSGIASAPQIKKTLFIEARERLKHFIQDQHLSNGTIEAVVTKGTPFLEINKKAIEKDVNIVIMGTHGTSGNMKSIFFGSTTERVLRFIKKPVLCVPIEEDRKDT